MCACVCGVDGMVAGVGEMAKQQAKETNRSETATPPSDVSSYSGSRQNTFKPISIATQEKPRQQQQQHSQEQDKLNKQLEVANRQIEMFYKQESLIDIQSEYYKMKTEMMQAQTEYYKTKAQLLKKSLNE